jgi:hypothetical protein
MPGLKDTLQKDMVPGELFPTLHWMTWRMGAWMHGTFESCSHANMQSFIHIIPPFPL